VIVDAFQSEIQSGQYLEKIAMEGDIEAMRLSHDVKRGQLPGLAISIFGLFCGTVLVYLGHDRAGSVTGAGGLASVLAAYFKSDPTTPKAE